MRIAFVFAGAALGALALAQLLLPGFAEQRVRSRVGRYGGVQSVRVHAFPAIELLWGHADSVSVRAGDLRLTPTQTVDLLAEARGVGSLDVAARSLRDGPLTLHGARLRKRGSSVYGEGEVRAEELRALPGGLEAQPLRSGGGSVRVRASGGLFGVRASLVTTVGPSEGKLVAQPEDVAFAGFARVTLFADRRLAVEAVGFDVPGGAGASGAAGESGAPPSAYRVWLTARLTGRSG